MPELPEVETVRKTLKLKLIGKKILSCNIFHDNIIEYPNPIEFKQKIINQSFLDIKRYGKWLIFELNDYYLFSHLRMEGKYFFRDKGEKKYKHEHVIFGLDNNTEFRYMDVRKFGKMHLIKKEEINNNSPILKMGLEPWDPKLDINYLKDKFKTKKLPIKTVILDQSIIAGIGNIYANEILFASNINPLKKAMDLNDKEIKSIIDNTKIILEKAIEMGGSTIHSYTSVDGVTGLFQQELMVHLKEGMECKKCGSPIIKIAVGGRGTYYCPKCQK